MEKNKENRRIWVIFRSHLDDIPVNSCYDISVPLNDDDDDDTDDGDDLTC